MEGPNVVELLSAARGRHNRSSDVFNATAADVSSASAAAAAAAISPELDKIISVILIIVLFITMVSLGCTMEVAKIKDHIVKPRGVAIAVLAQYGIMPLTAFCLAKVGMILKSPGFRLSDVTAVVVLICGCCPGGSLSNILALALQGDMNLSIVMTSCSTLLALAMMPLLLYVYCRGYGNLQEFVPYVNITLSLLMILVPCGAGVLINYYRPQYSRTITKVGLSITAAAVAVIGVLASVAIEGSILTVLSPPLVATGALMPLTGYAFGYLVSSLFKLSHAERRTVAMETGCQNIQLCSTILKTAFPPAVIGPLFLFPMVYVAFQLTEAAALIVLFRCHRRLKLGDKEAYQQASTEGGKLGEPPRGV